MNIGLVLQGGGMRGLYTSGVLDCFLQHNIEFKNVCGVSAGSLNAMNYLSKQHARSLRINMKYCGDKRFFNPLNIVSGNVFDLNFLMNDVPSQERPFDNETFMNSGARLTAVATNCDTGLPMYFDVNDMTKDYIKIIASSSLPMFSQPVVIDGDTYMDGGVTDPIPLEHSIINGCERNVVVLTRTYGHRKKPSGRVSMAIGNYSFKDHPKLLRVGATQHTIYNHSMEFVEHEERAGRAFVFRPTVIKVDRYENNPYKLLELYNHGYRDAKRFLPELNAFLNR